MQKLSVLIPTASRPELCMGTLKSLFASHNQAELIDKVVVIENGQKTSLEGDIAKLGDARVHYIFSEVGNKSHALNVGMKVLDEEAFILFIDDDIELSPSLCEAYAKAGSEFPDHSYFGGPTAVKYEVEPDEIARTHLPGSALGVEEKLDFGEPYFRYFLGFNWAAFKRDIIAAGGFNPLFGPGAKTRATGQETQMQIELQQQGMIGRYVPGALVYHHIPPSFFAGKWLSKRRFRSGVEQGLRLPPRAAWEKVLEQAPLRAIASWIYAKLTLNKARAVGAAVRASRARGTLRGMRLRHKLKTKPGHMHERLFNYSRSDSKRVLFLAHSSNMGGAERSLFTLVTQLRKQFGIRPIVIGPNGYLLNRFHRAQIETFAIDLPWWCITPEQENMQSAEKHKQDFLSLGTRAIAQCSRVIQKTKPDLVYTHTLTLPQGAMLAELHKIPHVVGIREYGELDHDLKFFWDFDKCISYLGEHSAQILTTSPHLRDAIIPQKFHSKTSYNYGLIEERELESLTTTQVDIKRLCQKENAFRILNAAAIQPGKGQADLVEAAKILKSKKIDFEILLAGRFANSDYVRSLQDMIDAYGLGAEVTFLDYVPDLSELRRTADVVVTCSRFEAFGRSAAEALFTGKALIYSSDCSHGDFIEDQISGLQYTRGNSAELAERLLELANNTELRKKLETIGPVNVRQFFDKNNFVEQTHRSLQNALKTTPKNQNELTSILLGSFVEGIPQNKGRVVQELSDRLVAKAYNFVDGESILGATFKSLYTSWMHFVRTRRKENHKL